MTIFPPEQKFLQDTQSKRMEKWFFRNMRIISIHSADSRTEPLPYSEGSLHSENLLVLYFDDVEEGSPDAMTPEQAGQIVDFVGNCPERMIYIHYTSGHSAAMAVHDVLNWYFNCFLEDNPADYRLNNSIGKTDPVSPNPYVQRLLQAELQRRYGEMPDMLENIHLRQCRKSLQHQLRSLYALKSFDGNPQFGKWFQKFDCIWFSKNVISGDPEVIRMAESKFLHSQCGVTSCQGKLLIVDIGGEGKMGEIFDQMLQLATPETYAVKGDDPEEFFAPFEAHFRKMICSGSKYFQNLLKNSPKDAAIFLLAEKCFKHVGIYNKQFIAQQAKKFDALCENLRKK